MKCFKKLKALFQLNRKEREKNFKTSVRVCGDTSQREMYTNKIKRFNRSEVENITLSVYENLKSGLDSSISTEVQKDIYHLFKGVLKFEDFYRQNFLVARAVKMNDRKREEIESSAKILSKLHPDLGFKLTFNPFDFRDEDIFLTALFLNGKTEWLFPKVIVVYDKPELFNV